jgi:hypothetical protein
MKSKSVLSVIVIATVLGGISSCRTPAEVACREKGYYEIRCGS